MEVNLINNFKLLMKILKTIPLIYATVQFIQIIIEFLGYNIGWLGLIGGVSLIPLLFLFLSSYVFKFCYYHRLPLYYLLISQIICIVDYYIGIPISIVWLFIIHLSLFCWLILRILYFKRYEFFTKNCRAIYDRCRK